MTKEKQIFNPFLPLNEYIPDAEPHIFGDRVYIYGSHDKEGGYTFCMLDYVSYSAPIDDLTDWRYEGVIYRREQDPEFSTQPYMYAPDVVKGNDGRYYLYYCTSGDYGEGGYQGTIKVAVCDEPAGEYKYLGYVRNKDGTPMMKYICFDPAVINDDGVIRLCYGTQYDFEEQPDFKENESYINTMITMFGRSKEEILSYEDSIMGPATVTLCDDMLTVADEPRHIVPYKVKGTPFEDHPFFEAASLRKFNDKYYFIYSSLRNHELCYAISDKPDRDFKFAGTLVSNGDIGIDGRDEKERLNMTGTTHGSVIKINNQYYVFYHRLTHRSDYSRQVCAEKIYMDKDGLFRQARITSCGLNKGSLAGEGTYPAPIACVLTNGNMPHGSNRIFETEFPAVMHYSTEQFIAGIEDGTLIGFRSFSCRGLNTISVKARFESDINKIVFKGPMPENEIYRGSSGDNEKAVSESPDDGYIEIRTSMDKTEEPCGIIKLKRFAGDNGRIWNEYSGSVRIKDGVRDFYMTYHGNSKLQFKEFTLICDEQPEEKSLEDVSNKEDKYYMKKALKLAKKAAENGEVPIGCVIVKDGEIIGKGYNRRKKDRCTLSHAEVTAIRKASKKLNDWRLEDCTMYVTLEPCQMCAGAIVQARVKRVVIGCESPKSGCGGTLLNILQNKDFNHQVMVTKGVLAKKCSNILSDFFMHMREEKENNQN